MCPLRLTKEEYELLDSAITIMKREEAELEEKFKVITERNPDKDLDIWGIVMDSGDVLGYEEMESQIRERTCDNNCAASCKISCITGCKTNCEGSCKGSCKGSCGNAYRCAAGQ